MRSGLVTFLLLLIDETGFGFGFGHHFLGVFPGGHSSRDVTMSELRNTTD